jgi:hypothetical protein
MGRGAMSKKQPPLYLITGIIIGLLAGVLVSRVILPVRYTETSPDMLSTNQKDAFRALVARAYLYEGDKARALTRLALLGDENSSEALVSQAQQMVAANEDQLSARGLALLASALTNPAVEITPLGSVDVQEATATPILTGSPAATKTTPPATATPFITYTPRPTSTPKAAQGSPYQLVGEPKQICDPHSGGSMLMVYVYDKSGTGVSGVRIQISIPDGGSSDFYTGLYPEISNGYADYMMTSGFTYSLRVGEGGDIISGLEIPQCAASNGSSYPGSLELKFKQP